MTTMGQAVSIFGVACKAKLTGPGDREAAIRAPIEGLITTVAANLELKAVPYDEVRDVERAVRPDYAIGVNGVITGYVEVKRPGTPLDPSTFTAHNKTQWDRQRDLPNLVYTNGTEWWLWRDALRVVGPVHLAGGPLDQAGSGLTAPPEFEALLVDFLRWKPAAITSVGALVRAIAPLTRLLRGEVLDELASERSRIAGGAAPEAQPFTGMARDWRALLFPTAADDVFADGYAQAVTFALLLARSEGLALDAPLHEIGDRLDTAQHSLMGRALQLLTDHVAADFKVTLGLLVRVVGAVDWGHIRAGRRDVYLHLYEHFLDVYDPELRKQSGSYYTPSEVVEHMVRLTHDVLVTRLGRPAGFADPEVLTVDPAMGTGTYLHRIIDRVAESVEQTEGPGAVPAAVEALARRLIGFELQLGPYAVAQLRTSDLLHALGATTRDFGLRLYVTDTLDDPYAAITQLGYGLETIARSRRMANEVKRRAHVTVVIGNPPYRENAGGLGGWIENGDPATGTKPPLNAFRTPGDGRYVQNMKNLYVYFWRWATWKVFDAHRDLPDGDTGIVCFISTSGYLAGPGFKGMREYLRRTCSEGWVINLTPEGQTPDVPTRIFPGVRQPLAIGLFVRRSDVDPLVPATIRCTAIAGRQAAKFRSLESLGLDNEGWRNARTGWQDPLTPAASGAWDAVPSLGDLLPWALPGVATNRTWVISPSRRTLVDRWRRLVTEMELPAKRQLLKETPATTLESTPKRIPGPDTHQNNGPLSTEVGPAPIPVPFGYRAFDRQWIIPDARLMHRPRPTLWTARIPGQVFAVEQHSKSISSGPGIVLSALIPDMDHFKGSEGGRALPLLHPGGRPNVAPGLLDALSVLVGAELFTGSVSPLDLFAYVAAVVAHPAYTETFADELTTPGIRVPLTGDSELWQEAVELGQGVVWAHTYGEACADPARDRPAGNVRFPAGDPRRVRHLTSMTEMPTTLAYDEQASQVRLGDAAWGPVDRAIFDYAVGGRNVLKSWFNYRKAVPGGKKTSPLDEMHVEQWPAEWSAELTDLLSLLGRLVASEPAQASLLERILAGPLLTTTTLTEHGVRWPQLPKDRKPRYDALPAADTAEIGQMSL